MTASNAERIPVSAPWLAGHVRDYVLDCVESGWVSSLGTYVARFEQEFAAFCECDHAVATSSGTAALHLALAAIGLGAGDEVLVPDLTFVATANAVTYTGATPVLVDVDAATWTIDPMEARRRVTPRTKALIVVHLYGLPADMDALLALADEHGLVVVEDAAQAHGARYKGRVAGSLGDISAFSFYGNKIITTGEGGMVVTHDEKLASRARLLRGHAMDPVRRYYHSEVGFNHRMTNIQAAIGCAQMEQVAEILDRRRRIADAYERGLAGAAAIEGPPSMPWADNVHWMYSILIGERGNLSRDELARALDDRGIETRPFFVPLHQLPAFRCGERFPVASRLAASGLNLPSGNALTAAQIERVCAAIQDLSGVRFTDAARPSFAASAKIAR